MNTTTTPYSTDVLIVGSGFGGSVAALRLAEKGYSVVVLEQGKRYRTEDFPRTNWSLRRYLWLPRLGLTGIQVLTLFRHALVLHGRGVGGGSLVYANTLIEPDPSVFDKPEWRTAPWRDWLAPHYKRAKRMLGATACQGVGAADEALDRVLEKMGSAVRIETHDVGVFFGEPDVEVPDPFFDGEGPSRRGCTRCGACMIGCPVGAKNTLDKNYLWLAERRGVRIVPEVEALAIRPIGVDGAEGYEVETRRSIGLRRPRVTWRARRVVVSGGVVGTVRLLLESRRRGWLPHLSPHLGRHVRTNSEALLAADSSRPGEEFGDHVAITSGVDIGQDTRVEIVRFNRGSDALFWLMAPLTRGANTMGWIASALREPLQALRGFWPVGRARRTAIVLAMQATGGELELSLRRRWSRLGGWGLGSSLRPGQTPPASDVPVATEIALRLADHLGGAAWRTLPTSVLGAPTTAHPLGGCRMGRDASDGVVDTSGEIYGYPGLHVADGSVVPSNLGVNPALTITALAEHMMSTVSPRSGE